MSVRTECSAESIERTFVRRQQSGRSRFWRQNPLAHAIYGRARVEVSIATTYAERFCILSQRQTGVKFVRQIFVCFALET